MIVPPQRVRAHGNSCHHSNLEKKTTVKTHDTMKYLMTIK